MQRVGVIEDLASGYIARHIPTNRVITLKLADLQMSSDFDLLIEMSVSEQSSFLDDNWHFRISFETQNYVDMKISCVITPVLSKMRDFGQY